MSKYTPKQFAPHVYPEWGELISDLEPEKAKEVMMAIFQYPNYNPNIGIWRFIKSQIDKDYQEFIARNQAHKEVVKKYWDNKGEQKETKDNKCSPEENKKEQTDNKGEPITYNVKRITNNEERNISVASCFIKQAERLGDIVRSSKNIKIDGRKISSWSKSFEQLSRIEGVANERIENALSWYAEHIGEEYVPVVESGDSFRKKFLSIENAMKRSGDNKPEREDWYL